MTQFIFFFNTCQNLYSELFQFEIETSWFLVQNSMASCIVIITKIRKIRDILDYLYTLYIAVMNNYEDWIWPEEVYFVDIQWTKDIMPVHHSHSPCSQSPIFIFSANYCKHCMLKCSATFTQHWIWIFMIFYTTLKRVLEIDSCKYLC